MRKNRGFTLIELAIVLIVIATMLTVVVNLYNQDATRSKTISTVNQMEQIDGILYRYSIVLYNINPSLMLVLPASNPASYIYNPTQMLTWYNNTFTNSNFDGFLPVYITNNQNFQFNVQNTGQAVKMTYNNQSATVTLGYLTSISYTFSDQTECQLAATMVGSKGSCSGNTFTYYLNNGMGYPVGLI